MAKYLVLKTAKIKLIFDRPRSIEKRKLSVYKNEIPKNVSDNDEKIKSNSVNFMSNFLRNYSSRPWK